MYLQNIKPLLKHGFTILFILSLACCRQPMQIMEDNVPVDTVLPLPKTYADTAMPEGTIVPFNSQYTFDRYRARMFTGRLAAPDFTGNELAGDKEYVAFISRGCVDSGINFGGRYTILPKGCGAMCEYFFIVDRMNGKIYTGLGTDDGRYGYMFRKDSSLVIANANVFEDEHLTQYNDFFGKPELYVWKANTFTRLE